MLNTFDRPGDRLGKSGILALLISLASLGGCDSTRPFGGTIVDGLNTAGKATVDGLNVAARSTVGAGQWVIDGGRTGIRGRAHGLTEKPFLLITGLRYPGIKLSELTIHSMNAVDGRGKALHWSQGQWPKSKYGPALTITVDPEPNTRAVEVTGVLFYRNGRWSLSARCTVTSGGWITQRLEVVRQ